MNYYNVFFFFSSRRRHTRCYRDWSSDVCSSDLGVSRTVIREAMILLEEDHWLENRPGNGRFVTSTVPDLGLSRLRPINDLLAEQVGRTSARLLRIVGEPATEFVAAGLDVHAGAPTVLAEYLIVEEASSKPLAYCLDC